MATTVETSNAVTNITVTTGTQNVFSNIATDSGTVVVDSTVDTLTITGAGGITTAGNDTNDTVTITQGPANLTTKDTDDLSEGSTNLYYTDTRFDTRLGTKTTDNLTEGSSNLYFTNARADARIAAATIDADSTTIQNLEVDNLKSGVLDTDISSVAATDTTLASAKAIKTYVDSQILTKDNTDEITEGSTNLYFTNARADARIAASSIDALSDVDTTTAAPSSNQILLWNGSNFVPGDVSSGAGYQSTDVLSDLNDVTLSSTSEGQILVFDASAPTQFVNRNLSGAITLDGDGVTALAADTVNDTHIDFGTGTNQVNTDDLPEGSTNLYYTDARAQAVSINNLSEDTTPELGGTLDILGNDIKSSTANVVISADANDKDVELKIKDTGGTLRQAAHFNTYTYKEASTDADETTNADNYLPVLDIPFGLRIGDASANFTSNGQTSNNFAAAYNQTGVLITNGDNKFWPTLNITSYGGANPLVNQLGPTAFGGVAAQYPSAAITLGGASGSQSSPSAILQDDRLGQIGFTGYDGSKFGGQGSIASASITVTANETFSTTGTGAGRGAKMVFDILKTGETDPDNADNTSDRNQALVITGDLVHVNAENNDMDFRVDGSNNDNVLKVDAGKDKVEMGGVMRLHQASSDPSSNLENGDMYYNTTTHKFRGYANGAWTDLH